jgi:hypothetical protein
MKHTSPSIDRLPHRRHIYIYVYRQLAVPWPDVAVVATVRSQPGWPILISPGATCRHLAVPLIFWTTRRDGDPRWQLASAWPLLLKAACGLPGLMRLLVDLNLNHAMWRGTGSIGAKICRPLRLRRGKGESRRGRTGEAMGE